MEWGKVIFFLLKFRFAYTFSGLFFFYWREILFSKCSYNMNCPHIDFRPIQDFFLLERLFNKLMSNHKKSLELCGLWCDIVNLSVAGQNERCWFIGPQNIHLNEAVFQQGEGKPNKIYLLSKRVQETHLNVFILLCRLKLLHSVFPPCILQ